ncbi:hypothetical protein T310_6817 [Rasamsonia emersonii CBS 393.64]|uniref:HAUS augmin-like complex subunit 6 N-terminal domain-containing protein n=1 Tax=Rasamsonia emersonii (strain ATCC 16479 / CBS 393.64 / IMI 116815) TaxID=1408163 RepID=A0A0F4YMZ5_RASE3|nr:hypothetical protein T310_6817 [Rasamsonia emersonii CBS 393.64]KKA19206.1 hypothetical protein T310_6817 [Rasamsonia emersonii CBS 393.64]
MQSSHPPASVPWASPSPVTVFLRNLRLLQLDQQPDWPDLSARLFSGGQQSQRQRIKGVEWALYHLFAIWDPEGTKNKLRPFFPPLEPLQSLNLRGALFRCLSDLKKNGDLGRETILRKTMLDDCKGAKFEEVLAIFSTAVLRKVVTENADAPGLKLGLAKSLTQAEYERLVPLILAHLSSLNTTTQKKERVRSNCDQFSRLLDEKAAELADRSQKKLQPPDEIPGSEKLVHEVKTNWFGSEDWADTLLYGGSRGSADGFLELPFEEAWSRANKGTVSDLKKPHTADLLLDLEHRLSQQRDRLRQWQEFREAIQKEEENEPKEGQQARSKNKSLVFREHQTLSVASISKTVRQPTGVRGALDERHEDLLSSMKEALAKVKGETVPRVRSESQDAPRKVQRSESTHDATALSPIPDEDNRAPTPSPNITVTTPDLKSRAPSPDPPQAKYSSRQPFGLASAAASRAASPSPEDDALDRQQSASPEPELPSLPTTQAETRPSTLVERTRQSMSLLPPPRQSASFRRPPRQSQQFPVNPFETPTKQQQQQQQQQQRPEPPSRSGASTPRDELFSEDADYASVFKSRPRVANSPLFSPAVHVGLDEDDTLDLGGGMDSSPLAGARMR